MLHHHIRGSMQLERFLQRAQAPETARQRARQQERLDADELQRGRHSGQKSRGRQRSRQTGWGW
jgi:hypothetical protein